jgi:hypothetical protein
MKLVGAVVIFSIPSLLEAIQFSALFSGKLKINYSPFKV